MREPDVRAPMPEERKAVTDEHGHGADDESLEEPGVEESLDGLAPVHIHVPTARGRKSGDDLAGLAGECPDRRATPAGCPVRAW